MAAGADDWIDRASGWANDSPDFRPFDKDEWWISGARFTNITVPKNAVIDSAYLILHANSSWEGPDQNSRIKGFDEDNHTQIASRADYEGRDKTTAYYDWYLDFSIDECEWKGKEVGTNDLTSIIQEIVNRAGWASGNALGLIVNTEKATGGAQESKYDSYDHDPDEAPKLEITYHMEYEVIVSESLGMVDAVPAPKGFFKIAVPLETLGMLDSTPTKADFHLTAAESLGMLDSTPTKASLHLTVDESLGMLDTALRSKGQYQTLVESLGMVESVEEVKGLHQTVAEVLGMLESVAPRADLKQEALEVLGLLDSIPTRGEFHLITAEILGMVESVAPRADFKQAVVELLAMADVVGTKAAYKVAVVEILGMLDWAWRGFPLKVTVAEILMMRDKLERRKRLSRMPDLPDDTTQGGAPT